jgi:uncharacterized protein YegL
LKRVILLALALCASALAAASAAHAASVTPAFTATNLATCSATSTLTLTLDAVDPPAGTRPMDVIHVMDESGSIAGGDFSKQKLAIQQWANGQVFGPTAVMGGVVAFSTTARIAVNLTAVKTTFVNTLGTVSQRGGSTAIGEGILAAQNHFASSGRSNALKVIILSTDGYNNINTQAFPGVVAAAKAAGIVIFTIGIGPDIDTTELSSIASVIPGMTTQYLISDYSALSAALSAISTVLSPAASNAQYRVVPALGWEIIGASATTGTVTSTAASLAWTAPELRTGRTTITYTLKHTGTTGGTVAPQAIADLSWMDDAGAGQTASYAGQTVTVSGCNNPPVAAAGDDVGIELNGSHTANVTLDGTGSTDDGQVAPLTYSWSEGSTSLGTGSTLAVPFGLGTHTVTLTVSDGQYTSTDEVTITVVDPTPPTVTPSLAGTLGVSGWYTSDVGVTWTVTDAESEVTSTGCEPVAVAADTADVSFTCSATSAGGTTTVPTPTIKRDATKPTVTYASNAGTYSVADTVAITCAAADNLSGIASTTCVDVNAPAYSFGAGTETLSASATDVAGNVGTGSTSFTVTLTGGSLCTLTKQFVRSSERYQALGAQQQAALDAHTAAACNALDKLLPRLSAKQKAVAVKVYEQAVSVLAKQGWLTQAQASVLVSLAKSL